MSNTLNQNTIVIDDLITLAGGLKEDKDLALQGKVATPSSSSQVVAPDEGYYGLSRVTVEAIPASYEEVADEAAEYTAQLDELEAAIDELPEAGGGGVNLIYKTGNCNFTIKTMYEPGSDLCSVTFDDASINLLKCIELYMHIRFESITDVYTELFMSNTKSIGGEIDESYHCRTTGDGWGKVSSWINFPPDGDKDDEPINLLFTSGSTIAEITYKALMVE